MQLDAASQDRVWFQISGELSIYLTVFAESPGPYTPPQWYVATVSTPTYSTLL